MTKQQLIDNFIKNHLKVVHYVDDLDNQRFIYSYKNKWTAGQQLKHILLTVMPFPKVLLSKEFILEKFGKITRSTWDYETVLENYLKTNLKAPEQFLPEYEVKLDEKNQIISDINKNLDSIKKLLNNYSEEELDKLILPHPLLGKLTIREMFYLMTYHPLHHLKQIKMNLAGKN